jgi:hypothetical protein
MQPQAQLPNANYGEQKAYKQLQQDAPMAASSGVPSGQGMDFASMFGNPASRVVPLGADTSQPNTPVTDGAAMGMGAGLDALGLTPEDMQSNAKLKAWLPALEGMANKPDSSAAARALIRQLKAAQ